MVLTCLYVCALYWWNYLMSEFIVFTMVVIKLSGEDLGDLAF